MKDQGQSDTLDSAYQEMYPYLEGAKNQLELLLQRIIANIEDKVLVRAHISGLRIKDFNSLGRKVRDKKIDPKDALYSIGDLVGARVVCNNTQDVYRFGELLREHLPEDHGMPKYENYIQKPKSSGYRALHVNFLMPVFDPQDQLSPIPLERFISCEVQIRTWLQHGWAELTHYDIYKEGITLPPDLLARTHDLAEHLATADRIAESIRGRVARERHAPEEQPNLDTISLAGLAYMFSYVFGRNASEYVIQAAHNAYQEVGLDSLAEAFELLNESEFRQSLSDAHYQEISTQMTPEDIFLVVPIGIAHGKDKAIKAARKQAKKYREEIENYWHNEVLNSLPESFEEFMEDLLSGDLDVVSIAEVFGAVNECICGETVIDPEAFEYCITEHYGVDQDYQIYSELARSGLYPVGDWEYPTLCPWCGHQWRKDD